MTYEGEANIVVLVVSIYQCCKLPTNKTGITSYHQQQTILSERNKVDHDPRRNFYTDMCAFLRNLISTTPGTVKPLLLGDWNEECTGKSNCKKLCDEFGLVDLFAHKYPIHDNFKTYQQGTKRIDIAIGHIDLAGKVKKATYEPFGFRKGMGDHRGSFYDILEKDLFGNDIDNIYRQNGRSLHSKDCKQVPSYLKTVHKHLVDNNIYKRITKLMKSDIPNNEEAEKIDREITRGTKAGEKKCETRHNDYWDNDIHTTKMKLAYWSYLIRRRQRHLSTTALCSSAMRDGIDMSNTPTIEVITIISNLKIEMKKHYKDDANRRDEFLLNQANLAADATEEEKANAIRNIKKHEKRNHCYRSFNFHRGAGTNTQEINRIEIPVSWKTMEEYQTDDEFHWINP